MTFTPAIDPDIEYPDSDGKPMADNTEQYEWIVKIKENLEILFANSPNVFIAGDLLWYPVQDKKITGPVAPDVMVVFGRPKGRRGSYKQWHLELSQKAEQASLQLEQERLKAERLAEYIRSLGIDPDTL
ncbi:hypothetical protein [Microcystis aeruginosa]|uniref:hypothetical protein n=1 Tax=Microcystis aeruginosa TaxID=1126 RepID=UPI0002ACB46D|nr:hypothetical protein [Microcystis aeruginosa]ELS44641.1 hypothetical protein C789_5562 [Microcystis aeruginosa FACHB-905 = DIANCHI905]